MNIHRYISRKNVQKDVEHNAQGMHQPTLEELRHSQLDIDETKIEVWRTKKKRLSKRHVIVALAKLLYLHIKK